MSRFSQGYKLCFRGHCLLNLVCLHLVALFTGKSIFITELQYRASDDDANEERLVEVVLPMTYPYKQLVFATYSFAVNGSSVREAAAYLNGTAPAAAVVNSTVTQPPTYGWRVLVVRLPGNLVIDEGDLHGIALVVSCPNGTYNVTDFVCYGDPGDYPTRSPVASSGLARGKGAACSVEAPHQDG